MAVVWSCGTPLVDRKLWDTVVRVPTTRTSSAWEENAGRCGTRDTGLDSWWSKAWISFSF